jgi:hypothetical protein
MSPRLSKKPVITPIKIKFTKTEQIANLRRMIRRQKARGKSGSDTVLALRNRLNRLKEKR